MMGREAFDEAMQGSHEGIICLLAEKSNDRKQEGNADADAEMETH